MPCDRLISEQSSPPFPRLGSVVCSKTVAHLCSSTSPPTSLLVPAELCVPFQAWMIKKGEEKTEKDRNLTHSHFPELYLFTWYVWLVGCMCEVFYLASQDVILHGRLASIEGPIPSKVVFHRRSSSIEGHFSPPSCL